MFWVYIIQSNVDGRFYKGLAKDIDKRVEEHNSGKTKSTRPYKPWKLVYLEEYKTREEARKRELFFKSGEGRELLKQILDP